MDVYLIPTVARSARASHAPGVGLEPESAMAAAFEHYELYYEAPDEVSSDGDEDDEPITGNRVWRMMVGLFRRMRGRFSEALREAEEWRHRRHEADPAPLGLLARGRRKLMGFIVERIAEQRLLWHLRTAPEVCARIPADISEGEADTIIRTLLARDADHHRKWLIIDSVLLVPAAMLTVVPGPNVLGLYFTFQVVGHWLSWQGAKHGVATSPWSFKPSSDLTELRGALGMTPAQRQRCFQTVAQRLRLAHLATFLEDVAARPA